MADTTADLQAQFYDIYDRPAGDARTDALAAHLEAVDADGDPRLTNLVLVALANAIEWSHDSARQLMAFSRLRGNYSTAPESFDDVLLFHFTWLLHTVTVKMIERTDVSLASIEEFIDETRRRYAEAGHSLYSAHEIEHRLAVHVGDEARAVAALEAMRETEYDLDIDCEACIVHVQGAIDADAGSDESALLTWDPIVQGRSTCPLEPHQTLAATLLPLVRLGDLDTARRRHLHGYQMVRGKTEMSLPIGDHVRFCALTGNEARAVEILSTQSHLFTLALDARFRLRLVEAVQLTAAALIAGGRGDLELPGPDGERDTAERVHDRADAERRDLCERFDRRNGTDAQSRGSAARVAFTADLPHVPLGLKTTPRDAAAPVRPRSGGPEALPALIEAAREAGAAFADEAPALWRRVADHPQRASATLDPGDEADVLLCELNESADPAKRRELAARAITLLRRAGREGRALAVEAAVLELADLAPESMRAEAARLGREAEAMRDTDPTHSLRARVALCRALADLARAEGAEPGAELSDSIRVLDTELAARAGEPGIDQARSRLSLLRAGLAETETETREAVLAAREQSRGHAHESIISALWLAGLLRQEGRHDEALPIAEEALALTDAAMPAASVAAAHFTAGELAANAGAWDRCETYSVTAAGHFDRAARPESAAAARHLTGLAMSAQDRPEAAVIVLEDAAVELADTGQTETWRLVDVHAVLAQNHAALGDPEAAVRRALEALRLMDAGTAHPDATRYARSAQLAGLQLDRLGRGDDARAALEASERAWRELGALPSAAPVARARVLIAHRTGAASTDGGPDAHAELTALAEELRADRLDAELPEAYRQACRAQLAATFSDHADIADGDEPAAALAHRALDVLTDEPFDQRLTPIAHDLLVTFTGLDRPEAARAVVERVGAVCEPADPVHRELRAGLQEHLEWLSDPDRT